MVIKRCQKAPDTQSFKALLYVSFDLRVTKTKSNFYPFLYPSTAFDTPPVSVSTHSQVPVLIYSPIHTKHTPICNVSESQYLSLHTEC